jgi:diadenosine tetraphosphate (Ap4A) HIT family hydrolase
MSHPPFSIHPQLTQASLPVCELPLSSVWLMNNQRFPWLLLIPRRDGVQEIIDLPPGEQTQLWREIAAASHLLRSLFSPDKLNVASIGNLVPQLHIHVIARFKTDEAWPKPVFGFAPPIPYSQEQSVSLLVNLQSRLPELLLSEAQ